MIPDKVICLRLLRHLICWARILALLNYRQQHRRKNGNDGNNNQQFDEGECRTADQRLAGEPLC